MKITKIESETFHTLIISRHGHGTENDAIMITQECNSSDMPEVHVIIGIDALLELIDCLNREIDKL